VSKRLHPPKRTKAIRKGTWVVCFNSMMQPSTWGRVTGSTRSCSNVKYGKDAPIWESDAWATEHLAPARSEDHARNAVEDYLARIDYDPQ
jgi:hypothetical protein